MKHFYLLVTMMSVMASQAAGQSQQRQIVTNNDLVTAPYQTSKIMSLQPDISFTEFPINHNMHITSDGNYYYTINGGSAGSGQINKFDLSGNLLQTYPIMIDGRGLSYNTADGFLYVSTYQGNIVKITDLSAGTFVSVFSAIMQDGQASFAISPDGTKFYDYFTGTLNVRDFNTGGILNTIFGLSSGTGNFGGEAAVAVDSLHIYTWNATAKTVYTYDLTGNFIQTMVLDSGDNGISLSVANGYLFVSKDGNYNLGTWYGYHLSAPTAIAENENQFQATVLPNPTTGKLRFNSQQIISDIEIYSITGKLVYRFSPNSNSAMAELTQQSSGMYFYKIYDDNGNTHTGKFIIRKE